LNGGERGFLKYFPLGVPVAGAKPAEDVETTPGNPNRLL
jgi:hypothetical protein